MECSRSVDEGLVGVVGGNDARSNQHVRSDSEVTAGREKIYPVLVVDSNT